MMSRRLTVPKNDIFAFSLEHNARKRLMMVSDIIVATLICNNRRQESSHRSVPLTSRWTVAIVVAGELHRAVVLRTLDVFVAREHGLFLGKVTNEEIALCTRKAPSWQSRAGDIDKRNQYNCILLSAWGRPRSKRSAGRCPAVR